MRLTAAVAMGCVVVLRPGLTCGYGNWCWVVAALLEVLSCRGLSKFPKPAGEVADEDVEGCM